MDSASDKKSWWEEWKVLVYWVGIVLIMWLIMWGALWGICYDSSAKIKWGEAGTFGDMFGALSCLFSGLAFAGLIVTIRQQSYDLNLQREELRNTVAEAKAQTKLMDEQVKSQKAQLEMQKKQNEEHIFYMREQHTEIHTQRLTQEAQNQKAQAIDEFYRRLAFISTLEAKVKKVDTEQDRNRNVYTVTSEGAQLFQQFSYDICAIVKQHRSCNQKISFNEYYYNESIMRWVASVATLADDIYSRLFPKDEQGSHQTAQFYARVLMNSISDSGKDLLYFLSRSGNSRYLRESVDKLIELRVLHKEFITPILQDEDVQEAYRLTAMQKKYRT